jgi:hypothetical protein
MLLDLPGPALRLLTDVADFHFSDIAVRGDDGARACTALASFPRRRSSRPWPIVFREPRWLTAATAFRSAFLG